MVRQTKTTHYFYSISQNQTKQNFQRWQLHCKLFLERAILYQTFTRYSIVVVQQERKMRHRKASPLSDLDLGSREFDEWVTKNHMMLPNYLLDQIGILI